MTRGERIAGILAVVVLGGLAAIFATHALDWLNGQLAFSAGANVIQWVSGPATLAAVVTVLYGYFVRRCAMPFCVRRGEHPVDGTLKKVCHQHHTLEHHRRVHSIHGAVHELSDMLDWGQSHETAVSSGVTITHTHTTAAGGAEVVVGGTVAEGPPPPRRRTPRERKPGTDPVTDITKKKKTGA